MVRGFRVEGPVVVPVVIFVGGIGEDLASRWFAVFGAGGSSLAIAESGQFDGRSCLRSVGTGSLVFEPVDLFWEFGDKVILMVRGHGRANEG